MTQLWTNLKVPPMVVNYQDTYFLLSISKPGPVVIVLSQLDKRYFVGLEGEYRFELAFRVHRKGCEDYLIRSSTEAHYRMTRSVNVELDLEAGDYDVRIRIHARWMGTVSPEQVIKRFAHIRPVKLTRIGLAYDLAHRKGRAEETEDEKEARAASEKRTTEKRRQKLREQVLQERKDSHYLRGKMAERGRKEQRQRQMRPIERRRKVRGEQVKEIVQDNNLGDTNPDNANSVVATGEDGTITKDEEATHEQHAEQVNEERAALENQDAQELPLEKNDKEAPSPRNSHHTDRDWDKVSEHARLDDNFNGNSNEIVNGEEELSELSEMEMNMRIDALEKEQANREMMAGGGRQPEIDDDYDSPDMDGDMGRWGGVERAPWNAVAVIALRVYYKDGEENTKDEEKVKIKVVRPSSYPLSEDDGDNDGTGVDVIEKEKAKEDKGPPRGLQREESKSGGLDIDDSAKDATLVGSLLKREMSILGEDGWQKKGQGGEEDEENDDEAEEDDEDEKAEQSGKTEAKGDSKDKKQAKSETQAVQGKEEPL